MASIVSINYGKALFDLALEHDQVKEIQHQFQEVCEILTEHQDFWTLLVSPRLCKKEKKEMIHKIFPKPNIFLGNFLDLLLDAGRFAHIQDMQKEYEILYREHKGIVVAFVSTPIALKEEQLIKVRTMLEAKYQKNIELDVRIDQSLLAGMRIELAGEVFDNSIQTKLTNMKEQIITKLL